MQRILKNEAEASRHLSYFLHYIRKKEKIEKKAGNIFVPSVIFMTTNGPKQMMELKMRNKLLERHPSESFALP